MQSSNSRICKSLWMQILWIFYGCSLITLTWFIYTAVLLVFFPQPLVSPVQAIRYFHDNDIVQFMLWAYSTVKPYQADPIKTDTTSFKALGTRLKLTPSIIKPIEVKVSFLPHTCIYSKSIFTQWTPLLGRRRYLELEFCGHFYFYCTGWVVFRRN